MSITNNTSDQAAVLSGKRTRSEIPIAKHKWTKGDGNFSPKFRTDGIIINHASLATVQVTYKMPGDDGSDAVTLPTNRIIPGEIDTIYDTGTDTGVSIVIYAG